MCVIWMHWFGTELNKSCNLSHASVTYGMRVVYGNTLCTCAVGLSVACDLYSIVGYVSYQNLTEKQAFRIRSNQYHAVSL